eukprot:CFRG3596T1
MQCANAVWPLQQAPRTTFDTATAMMCNDNYPTKKVFQLDSERRQIMQRSEQPASDVNLGSRTPPENQSRLAIVYLTRNTKSDVLYQRDSNKLLDKSLDLLYKNVMPHTKADIIIFHEGDFDLDDQARVTKGREEIKFHTLTDSEWGPPSFIDLGDTLSWFQAKKYGIGYRNMIRFYSNRIWRTAHTMGYEYIMRLDEESFIHSPIAYDLVDFLTQSNTIYGYRQDQIEYPDMAKGWPEAVNAYLQHYDIEPTFLYEHCSPRNIAGLQTGLHDLHSYYNNFFIARVDFFTSPEVQQFLNYADRTGGYYFHRWGDAIVHTAAVQIFMDKSRVHKFDDFTYEHCTFNKTDSSLVWGGLAIGTGDVDGVARSQKFAAKHKDIMKNVW